jgi:hypothetical protein
MTTYGEKYGTDTSEDVFPVTPADAAGVTDGTTIRPVVRQVFCTGAGTIKFTTVLGITTTLTVGAGFFLQCAITRVWATGTTATGLIGYV